MDAPNLPVTLSRAELLDNGWTDGALHRATARGEIYRVRRGQYAASDPEFDLRPRLMAATNAIRGSVASHRTAALVHGLPILGAPPSASELTISGRRSGDASDAHLYRARLPADHVQTIGGLRVTTAARTIADMGRCQSSIAAVIAGDHALREGVTSQTDIEGVLADCRGWPGVRRAREAAALFDKRAESPLESYSRVRLDRLGVAAADLQTVISTTSGVFVARVDFYWHDVGVVGEADGLSKYVDRDVLIAEKRRQNELEDLGLIVVRWGWADVRDRPSYLAHRIEEAFARGRKRDALGIARRWIAS